MNVSVHGLTAEEHRQLTAARLVAVELAPYLAHALFATHAVAAAGLSTFAVDRGWRLYVDPRMLQTWGPQVAGGVLVHEVSHLVRSHAERAEALGPDRDHDRWNVACDLSINDDLRVARVPLPDGAVVPSMFGLLDEGIEEVYYAVLAGRSLPGMPTGMGVPDRGRGAADTQTGGCGSGAGDPAAEWELPADHAEAPVLSPADATMTRRRVAEAVREYAARHTRGTVPGGWQRWAADTLSPPVIHWRRILGSAVRRAIASAAGCHDYAYSRPGRRRIPHIVTPAMRRPVLTVAVVVDTSGSMGEDQVRAALAEISGVIRASGVTSQRTLVLACDAGVGAATRVRRVQDVKLVGGGGTDMRVGIDTAETSRPAPHVVIVLTDGYTPWPEKPPRARLVVAIIGEQSATANVPGWATVVHVPVS